MRALRFVQKLQETLNEVAENGGNRALFVVLDYDLVAQVRSYAYNHLEGQSISSANRATHTFISDLMSRDIFNSRIRYCIAKLQEFSMPSAQYFDLISQAIDVYLRSDHRSIHWDRQALNARVALLAEIARCFESW